MKAVLRSLAAVLAGSLVSFGLLIAVELFSNAVYPLPADFGGTPEEVCRHVEQYPQWVLAVVVPAWAVAAFAGTWAARRIGSRFSSAVVGLLLFAALAFNLAMLPYPAWFKIANLLVIPAAVLAGSRPPSRHKTAGAGDGV